MAVPEEIGKGVADQLLANASKGSKVHSIPSRGIR